MHQWLSFKWLHFVYNFLKGSIQFIAIKLGVSWKTQQQFQGHPSETGNLPATTKPYIEGSYVMIVWSWSLLYDLYIYNIYIYIMVYMQCGPKWCFFCISRRYENDGWTGLYFLYAIPKKECFPSTSSSFALKLALEIHLFFWVVLLILGFLGISWHFKLTFHLKAELVR